MKKIIAVILIAATLLSGLMFGSSALTADQELFLTQIIALAVEDMKTSNILASVTISQAIVESAWGQSNVAKESNNYFGIKAYSTSWTGKIYCYLNKTHYSSLQDLMVSDKDTYNKYIHDFYRVYNSMEESVKDHGEFLNYFSRYSKIPGNTDYEKVCDLLLEAGYCSDVSYPATLKLIIQQRNLHQYDIMEANGEVSRITLDINSINLKIGETYALSAYIVPLNAKNKTVSYSTNNAAVAKVTAAGVITAVKSGMATIIAKTANGMTASVTVYCNSTGTAAYTGVTTQSLNCRATPDTNSTIYGVFQSGAELVIYGEDTNGWRLVTGKSSSGSTLHGYVYSAYITITGVYDPDSESTPTNPSQPETPKNENEIKYQIGLIINSDLNIRSGPLATYNLLGTFTKGVEIILIGEPTENNWYTVIGLAQGNRVVSGWCGGAYISIKQDFLTGATPLGKKCYVDGNGYFRGASAGTKVNELFSAFESAVISVKNKNGNIKNSTDLICTGDIIEAKYNGITVFEASAVVKGDVNGDGSINALDYLAVRTHTLGLTNLNGVFLEAAKLSSGDAGALDYYKLRLHILNLSTISVT